MYLSPRFGAALYHSPPGAPQEPNPWVENFTDLVNPIVQTLHTQLMEASAGESTGAETVPLGRLLGWIALATQELYRVYQEWLIMADNARIYIAVVRDFSNRLRGAIIDAWGVQSAAVGDADSIYLIGFEDLQEKFQQISGSARWVLTSHLQSGTANSADGGPTWCLPWGRWPRSVFDADSLADGECRQRCGMAYNTVSGQEKRPEGCDSTTTW